MINIPRIVYGTRHGLVCQNSWYEEMRCLVIYVSCDTHSIVGQDTPVPFLHTVARYNKFLRTVSNYALSSTKAKSTWISHV